MVPLPLSFVHEHAQLRRSCVETFHQLVYRELQSFIGQALRPTNCLLLRCLLHYCVVMRVAVPNQVILMLPIIAKLGPNIIEVVLMKTGQIFRQKEEEEHCYIDYTLHLKA